MNSGISFQNVSFHYPEKEDVLHAVHFDIPAGSFFGITGVNGSGKSTLSYCMNGLIPHSVPGVLSGTVFVGGIDTKTKSVSYFSHRIGMVFQNPDFSLFNLTVEEEIAFGLKNLKGKSDKSIIEQVLRSVGLTGYGNRDPQTLSFGEKQKVCLASVLALDISYVILDEPTAMLDYKSSIELYALLRELNQKGKTIITIEHDTDFLWDYTSEVVIVDKGNVKESGSTKDVLSHQKLLTSLGIKKPQGVRT